MSSWLSQIAVTLLLLVNICVSRSTVVSSLDEIKKLTSTNGFGGENWAVLVAGSESFVNYRHQADVCHAYQILRQNGFPEDRIITFMYDDIANDPQNPYPGVIINRPGGPNVYEGVVKDYTGSDVSADMFLQVIEGNESFAKQFSKGSGKVLKSGPNDKVFLFFSGHGGHRSISFAKGAVTAVKLSASLDRMKAKNMFREMVIYLESCESGSVFMGRFPEDGNIYAVAATDYAQKSVAIYYDEERKVYLGDRFAVGWMEDSEQHFFNGVDESMDQQFQLVSQVAESFETPTQHGNPAICQESIAAFQTTYYQQSFIGQFLSSMSSQINRLNLFGLGQKAPMASTMSVLSKEHVHSDEVRLDVLQRRLKSAQSEAEKAKVNGLIALEKLNVSTAKENVFKVIRPFVRNPDIVLNTDVHRENSSQREQESPAQMICFDDVMTAFDKNCHSVDERHIRFVKLFASACKTSSSEDILNHIEKIC